jgi:ParB family chromosome partitioning protein
MELRRRALGRGLGALIPSAATADAGRDNEEALTVPVKDIEPNPHQPRTAFGEEQIEELAASIRERGLLQPLLVRRAGAGYQLIAGERRWRAAQRAGLTRVPVRVHDVDDRESLELALIENLQREDLNPMEEARAYERLSEEFGLTQADVAQRVGKSRSAVANSVRLLQLPPDIRAKLSSGALSAGHARSLLGLDSVEAQSELVRDVVERRLSVRDTERLVRERQSGDDPNRASVESELSRSLGTKVRLRQSKGGSGRIEIEFYSLDELNGLIARLTTA